MMSRAPIAAAAVPAPTTKAVFIAASAYFEWIRCVLQQRDQLGESETRADGVTRGLWALTCLRRGRPKARWMFDLQKKMFFLRLFLSKPSLSWN